MKVGRLLKILEDFNKEDEVVLRDILAYKGKYTIEFINKKEVLYHNGYGKFANCEILLMNRKK